MDNPPHILENGPQFFSDLLDKMLWAAVKGIGLGFWWAIKLLWLPFLVILLVWVGFVFVMRWIDEGELPVSFGWAKSFARSFSSESGWHQKWWGMLIIGAGGSGLWALIARIF